MSSSSTNRGDEWLATRVRLLGLAALLLWSGSCADPELPDPAALIPGLRTYYNEEIGVELEYPYTLSLAVDAAGGQLALDLQWVGRQTSMFMLETHGPEMEATLRQGAVAGSESSVMVGGLVASQFKVVGSDDEDQQRTLLKKGGRWFVFTGEGETFDKVLRTVAFPSEPRSEVDR